ncbi:aromatic amino acid transport family protein [Arenicella xantha]|uniref:Tryptophan-specific transport protein n=1 Tax=Arenicella xantha TaxID=644221 RepID=A0A395JUX2_9GAMM|nr:aromatic amino acid transport family protein [Arenicella xantha]RBP53358.1 tryptophan-specific transport protein [Arenicella xantha]
MKLSEKPIWHGVALVVGGAIGAGMFALPIVSSGMWFNWAVLAMLFVWGITYLAARLLADVNMLFPAGTSFYTLTKRVLGQGLAWSNSVSIAFILFILLYAYMTAGASITEHLLQTFGRDVPSLPRRSLSLVFALVLALLVSMGTTLVSRISSVLLVGMVVAFASANYSLLDHVQLARLDVGQLSPELFNYSWAALPVLVTAFACGGLVPSLVKYYPERPKAVVNSLFYGTLLVLVVYVLWLLITFGALPRSAYLPVIEQGGNVGDLVAAIRSESSTGPAGAALAWFSRFAIVTSFLSIGLSLFHFVGDLLHWQAGIAGRFKTGLVTFVPPALLSFIFPYGFVSAIGYAGLMVAFSFFVLPALMHGRRFGWSAASRLVVAAGLLIALLKVLSMLSLLPVYAA